MCADQLAYFQIGNDFKVVCCSIKLFVTESTLWLIVFFFEW